MNKEKALSRREFLVGAGAIAMGGLLAACGPSAAPTEAPPEEEAPAEEEAPEEAAPEEALTGELTFWMRDFWGGEMPEMIVEEYNKLVYRDAPEPEMGADQVLIRVKACGICGSDVHGMDGSTGRRQPPVIMGHEASGVVAKVGAGVSE